MRQLIISVHDVAPAYADEVRFLLAELDRLDARPRVLKVIPQFLEQSPELIDLLRREQDLGSEVVLHGFSHHTEGRVRGPWWRRLRARLFAANAAEFLSLGPEEMFARISQGRDILQRNRLAVAGFCAPGWLATGELLPALRRAGFRYDVTMAGVVDLATNRRIWTEWIGYMGAGPVQERLVGIANRINRADALMFRVVKIFLHPQSARRSHAAWRVLSQIPLLRRDRTLCTYGQLLER